MVLGNDKFSKDPLCYNEISLHFIQLYIYSTCRYKSNEKVDFNMCLLIR